MTTPFLFRRPALAREITDRLTGQAAFGAESTLVLAAPRRTGKTTFLRVDLSEELERRGLLVIYVDLWADKEADPGQLIGEAVARALESVWAKTARSVGLRKVAAAGVSVEVDGEARSGAETLSEALAELHRRSGHRIVLIVDEAQHALTTEAGETAMFGLKAARDALNTARASEGGPICMLVFTGSHRDKLARLVLTRNQPFFGTDVKDFPLLDRDYCEALVEWLNPRLASDNRFVVDDVWDAFQRTGYRPEILMNLLRRVAFDREGASGLGELLRDQAADSLAELAQGYESTFSGLSALQQAVLIELAVQGPGLAPFSGDALAAYGRRIGTEVEASAAQGAIEALRRQDLVWRSARGQYALEEQGLAEWLKARFAATSTTRG